MDTVKIGRFLAQLRHEGGMTQEQAGERLGVSSKTISRWENGVNMPDISMLPELARLYGVSVSELVAGERIEPTQMQQKTDELLLRVMGEETFSLRERERFFQRKWLRERGWWLILMSAAVLAVLIWYLAVNRPELTGLSGLAAIALYGWGRHRMMVYTEHKLYDP